MLKRITQLAQEVRAISNLDIIKTELFEEKEYLNERALLIDELLILCRRFIDRVIDNIYSCTDAQYFDTDCYFYPDANLKLVCPIYSLQLELEPTGAYSHIIKMLINQYVNEQTKIKFIVSELIDECTYFNDEETKEKIKPNILKEVLELYES